MQQGRTSLLSSGRLRVRTRDRRTSKSWPIDTPGVWILADTWLRERGHTLQQDDGSALAVSAAASEGGRASAESAEASDGGKASAESDEASDGGSASAARAATSEGGGASAASASAAAPGPAADGAARLSRSIQRRADAVQALGEYWGFFDWLAWGFSLKVRVVILAGDEALHLFEIFAPGDVAAQARSWTDTAFVVAAQGTTDLAEVDAAAFAGRGVRANHFLYAHALRVPETHDVDGSSAASAARARDALTRVTHVSDDQAGILAHYVSLGFCLVFTATQGDCAPDACCIHTLEERTPVGWKRQRQRVAQAMRELAGEAWFQDRQRNNGRFVVCNASGFQDDRSFFPLTHGQGTQHPLRFVVGYRTQTDYCKGLCKCPQRPTTNCPQLPCHLRTATWPAARR